MVVLHRHTYIHKHAHTNLNVNNVPKALKILAGDLLFTTFQLTVINEVRELDEAFLHEQLCLACSNTPMSGTQQEA